HPPGARTQQRGFPPAYPVQTMAAWVTDSPHWLNNPPASMPYRMLVSMQGVLGIGGNLNNWTDEDMAIAKRLVAAYHQVQKTTTQGALDRLISPANGSEFSATETVSPDKSQAVFFAFVHSTQEGRGFPRLQLLGLDPRATYALGSIEGKAAEGTPAEASGAGWMNHGIEVALRGDFQGA